ncbi:alpha/beta hydrolase [Corynebacterium sp. 22KM0430]|uniref:alpha/beta hydrolase n=1 Tax=Corynebacterium sp. 22KM0430 TaxID=2989735 RepID=UPI0029CAA20F|nr:alpha/beta hydrolase-fold protein [Corynebacterium sp. 22KM0430]WPF65958.1 alpha/beta hydrolase-fold protein [Corynebacterium sp. 22KM0430]
MKTHPADTPTARLAHATMPQTPEFLPPIPPRAPIDTALLSDTERLHRIYLRPEITPHPTDPELVRLTVARPVHSPTETAVLYLNALTHMNRERVTEFALERHGEWHVGSWYIPAHLHTSAGIILCDPLDPAIGHERATWRTALDSAVPLVPVPNMEAFTELQPAAGFPDITNPLHQSRWHSAALDVEVRAWLSPDPSPHATLLLMTDAEEYLNRTPLLPRLRTPEHPATSVLFFGPASSSNRDRVLTAGPALDSFIEKELLPWAARFSPPLADSSQRIIAGGSLGGFAAAGVVRRRPDLVPNAVVQSASFWWPDRSYAELAAWDAEIDPRVRVFHEVGAYEGFLRAENRRFAHLLAQRVAPGAWHSREYQGGHDYACWRKGILDALDWFHAQDKTYKMI